MTEGRGLPPGPREPPLLQTVEWVARPTAFLRRCHERHGDPCTIRVGWQDAPTVLVSDPREVRRVFTAPPDAFAPEGAPILAGFAGPHSILVLGGDEHLRQRRLMLPPFHGERLRSYRKTIAALAREETGRWRAGETIATHPRMQALTLEIILRVVLGARDPDQREALRTAIRRTLGLASSLPRLLGMTLIRRDLGPWRDFRRALDRVDALLYGAIAQRPAGGSVLADLLAARHEDGSPPTDGEVRDQLVTLLAAGHETTATSLAWAFERLGRHPEARAYARRGEEELGATVDEVLRARPVLTIAPRKLARPWGLNGYRLPPGTHVAPCIWLAHRREDLHDRAEAFRPQRFAADAQRAPLIPFGGGIRRCVGAAFATMELTEVLRAALMREFVADRPRPERPRRRTVTIAPERGGRIRVIA